MSEPDTEHAAGPVTPQTPVVSNYGLVLTVYILYLVRFLTGITVLVGLIIAYLQRDQTDRVSQSHFPVSNNNILDRSSIFFLGLLTCTSQNGIPGIFQATSEDFTIRPLPMDFHSGSDLSI
jgi:uncharacterized membrane protein